MLSEHPIGTVAHVARHEPTQAHYLLTNEAARLIGVAPQTIRVWERNGQLPADRTASGVRLFRRETCEQVKQQRDSRRAANESLEPEVVA
jgi:hypothetical protein